MPPHLSVELPPPDAIGDPAINQSDTYASAGLTNSGTIEVVSDEPLFDPVTETHTTSITVSAPTDQQHFEAGYDTQGSTIVNQYVAGEEESSDGIARMRIVATEAGDQVAFYDTTGARVTDEVVADGEHDLVSIVGSLRNRVTADEMSIPVTNPGGGGGGGGPCVDCQALMSGLAAQAGLAGGGAMRERRAFVRGEMHRIIEPEEQAESDGFSLDARQRREGRPFRRLTQIYLRRGPDWVIERSEYLSEERSGAVVLRARLQTSFRNVRFNRNAARDSARAKMVRAEPSAGSAPVRAPHTFATSLVSEVPAPIGRSPSPFTPPRGRLLPPPGPSHDIDVQGHVAGAPMLVLQHGFNSSDSLWLWMYPRLQQDMQLSRIYAISTASLDYLNNQAAELRDSVTSRGQGSNVVFLGHSHGGLLSRQVGTDIGALGVITMGTPNVGAPLVQNSRARTEQAFNNLALAIDIKLCGLNLTRIACNLIGAHVGAGVAYALQATLAPHSPASSDFAPGSYYLQVRNSQYEPMRRASITHNIRGSFKWARLVGDQNGGCWADGTYCRGRGTQRTVQTYYNVFRGCTVVSFFFVPARWAFTPCINASLALRAADATYDRLVHKGGSGDGVVPNYSQDYPNSPGAFAPQRYHISDGESHVAETRSVKSLTRLEDNALPAVGVFKRQ